MIRGTKLSCLRIETVGVSFLKWSFYVYFTLTLNTWLLLLLLLLMKLLLSCRSCFDESKENTPWEENKITTNFQSSDSMCPFHIYTSSYPNCVYIGKYVKCGLLLCCQSKSLLSMSMRGYLMVEHFFPRNFCFTFDFSFSETLFSSSLHCFRKDKRIK